MIPTRRGIVESEVVVASSRQAVDHLLEWPLEATTTRCKRHLKYS